MLMTDPKELPTTPVRNGASTPEHASWRDSGELSPDSAKFLYRWAGQLSSTLVQIRNRFGGDLDQYLLYLVFILQEIASPQNGARRRGLNALSLSEITQIPRETARRKLLTLAEAGYLRRDAEGLYYLGEAYAVSEVFNDLKPLFGDLRFDR
ncbi:MAG TPA: hypothetical protein VIO94_04685 [Phenylobacterium sp.]